MLRCFRPAFGHFLSALAPFRLRAQYLLSAVQYNLHFNDTDGLDMLNKKMIVTGSSLYNDRRLVDGDVHCAGSATYQIFFRLPIPNLNPIPNPKP